MRRRAVRLGAFLPARWRLPLAWLLHHTPNTLLIPGTADADHLEANIAVGKIELDEATLATLDAVESRSGDVPLA